MLIIIYKYQYVMIMVNMDLLLKILLVSVIFRDYL